MKHRAIGRYLILATLFLLVLGAINGCYKDKGNYTYTAVQAPVITNMDSVYNVFVGDSLVITPKVNLPGSLLASAVSSATVVTGRSARTTTTSEPLATPLTGTKSFT